MRNRKKTGQFSKENELYFFEETFRFYYPRLKKYATNILHDTDEAEDLVQDVFYSIWQKKIRLDKEKNPGSYLFTILKNKCLNSLRHKIVEEEYAIQQSKYLAEELYHISFKESGDFIAMEELLLKEMENIISEMPPKCQAAFRLKWFEGKKIREIAEIMKISSTMVDKHLAKGLQIARKKLDSNLYIFLLVHYSDKLS